MCNIVRWIQLKDEISIVPQAVLSKIKLSGIIPPMVTPWRYLGALDMPKSCKLPPALKP
jgi:hypothetical protein